MIPNQNDYNIGGVTNIKLVTAAQVAFCNIKKGEVSVLLSQNATWFTPYFTRESCMVDCPPSDDGALFTISISFKCPSDRIELYTAMLPFLNQKVLVAVEFASGIHKIFGTKENPLVLAFTPLPTLLPKDFNGVEIKVTGKDFAPGRFIAA